MANIDGFWSYVHADDNAESGRIAQLARDVVSQFEMLTGESINLFLDRDKLKWGNDWRPTIDASLSSVAFFVPVLTPRYFMSQECRRELNYFARQAQKLGVSELVMPILWIDVPALHHDEPADELMALTQRFQWSDWTNLRFSDLGSGEYRKAVADLATSLVDANAMAERTPVVPTFESVANDAETEGPPGDLDRLDAMDQSLPKMTEILSDVGSAIEEIGQLMQQATDEINTNSDPKAALATRLRTARKLAQDLALPATSVRDLGNDFATSLNDVDEGVRLIIQSAPAEVSRDPASSGTYEGFFQSIREMVSQAEVGLGTVREMIEMLAPIEKSSRDLRRPVRTLREGLTLFVDGLTVMNEWVGLIESVEPLAPSREAE